MKVVEMKDKTKEKSQRLKEFSVQVKNLNDTAAVQTWNIWGENQASICLFIK